jgi:hypothetical protein
MGFLDAFSDFDNHIWPVFAEMRAGTRVSPVPTISLGILRVKGETTMANHDGETPAALLTAGGLRDFPIFKGEETPLEKDEIAAEIDSVRNQTIGATGAMKRSHVITTAKTNGRHHEHAKKAFDVSFIEEFKTLASDASITNQQLAEHFNKSVPTIYNWKDRFGVPRQHRHAKHQPAVPVQHPMPPEEPEPIKIPKELASIDRDIAAAEQKATELKTKLDETTNRIAQLRHARASIVADAVKQAKERLAKDREILRQLGVEESEM